MDSDGDGLSNDKEAHLGTDPNNPDTDNDTILDSGIVVADAVLSTVDTITSDWADPEMTGATGTTSLVGCTDGPGTADSCMSLFGVDTDNDTIADTVPLPIDMGAIVFGTAAEPTASADISFTLPGDTQVDSVMSLFGFDVQLNTTLTTP